MPRTKGSSVNSIVKKDYRLSRERSSISAILALINLRTRFIGKGLSGVK